ncbi:metal-dependent hydrolase [Paenibacillus enshidis]|uniref:Metal-dependent hydrolase n=1 Tax=Paenibacillus enshidis TaxID=1458439 RepID=A0ABV5AYJ9_9BACL
MMGRTHLCIGTGVVLSIAASTDTPITLPLIVATVIGSLLPDIDEPNSLIVSRSLPKPLLNSIRLLLVALAAIIYFSNSIPAPLATLLPLAVGAIAFIPARSLRNISMILIGVGLLVTGQLSNSWATIIGACLLICAVVPHRGLTHTVYGLVVWSALLYYATYQTLGHMIWIAGGTAYLLHLLADAVTDHGIRPLPPLKYRLRFRLMSTGTRSGSIIEGVCILMTLALVVFAFFM